VIALDTNILVYALREDSTFHELAYACLARLAEGKAAWAIPWPCVHEFLAIVTHPKIFKPPTPLDVALDAVESWAESPTLILLAEPAGYWSSARALLESGRITGPQVHDARIAALCVSHGVTELWTADRDFSRFAGLATRNPLVG
jgi:toxin-antitoxin system PIN domain toxin